MLIRKNPFLGGKPEDMPLWPPSPAGGKKKYLTGTRKHVILEFDLSESNLGITRGR
jgi:hypothetical protein